jgi:hypothetical protein
VIAIASFFRLNEDTHLTGRIRGYQGKSWHIDRELD